MNQTARQYGLPFGVKWTGKSIAIDLNTHAP